MTRTQNAFRWVAVAALALSALAPAVARERNGGMAQACQADLGKFCKSVERGAGRVMECLKEHEADLAPACKSAIGAMSACAPEIKKICGDKQAGGQGAIRECVKEHAKEFSPECRGAITQK